MKIELFRRTRACRARVPARRRCRALDAGQSVHRPRRAAARHARPGVGQGRARPPRSSFNSRARRKRATADKDGRWMVKLDPIAASAEGRTLTVKTDPASETLNRARRAGRRSLGLQRPIEHGLGPWGLSNYGQATIAAAGDPQLRLFPPRPAPPTHRKNQSAAQWAVDAPASVPGFSAVAYFFGQELRHDLRVPVGLIESAVGGTVAEAWTPQADLEMQSDAQAAVGPASRPASPTTPNSLEAYKERESELLAKYEEELAKAKAAGKPEPGKPQPPPDPGHKRQSADRPVQRFDRAAGAVRNSRRDLVSGRIELRTRQGVSDAVSGHDRRLAKSLGPGGFPVPVRADHAAQRHVARRSAKPKRITTETTPNTAMAVTTDFGDATDIHPKQKAAGRHAAGLGGPALAYGEPIEYSGPTYDAMSVAGNRVTLTFKHLGGGLVAKDGELRGFTIAGADGKFEPAKATIEGDTVVVSSESVAAPVTVRYGWANVPDVESVQQGRLAGIAVSDRADASTLEPGLRTVAQRQGSDRLALQGRPRRSMARRRPATGATRPATDGLS